MPDDDGRDTLPRDRGKRRVFADPLLVALMLVQRLSPIVLLAAYLRGFKVPYLAGAALFAWLVATLQGARSVRVAQRARRLALRDAAWGVVRRSAATVRGGAHDELLGLLFRGLSARASLVSQTEPALVASIVAFPIAFVVAAFIDGAEVALITVVAVIAAAIVRVPFARRYLAALRAFHVGFGAMARDLGHGVRALEDLQAHGLAEAFAARLESSADVLGAIEARADRIGRLSTWAPLFAAGTVLSTTLLRSDATGASGLIRLATLVVLGPIALGVARGVVNRTRERADAAALDALAALPEDLPARGRIAAPAELFPIEWRDVTFRYPPALDVAALAASVGSQGNAWSAERAKRHEFPLSAAILERLTIRWSGARPLAIVGANGSGKSTLLALLLRLVDPTEGSVRVGGVDLRDLELTGVRSRIAYVPQRPLLLEGMSVAEAMRLVAPLATDEALLQALDRVSLGERLRARAKAPLDVPCASLSVGEAQRVAIARALARDAELLILDEPEASLDPDARRALRTLFDELVRHGTRLVVASQHAEIVPEGAEALRLPFAPGTSLDRP